MSSRNSDQILVPDEMILSFHLMHPGGNSAPGDSNAAFYLDGIYHLHYILRHQWRGPPSYSFVHVSSADMLHWNWHPTTLQPAFTGRGMFSGTGFLTRDGQPAYVGDLLAHELPDVAFGEDISCPNFIPLDGKWMSHCISHPFGCRNYLGDWDSKRLALLAGGEGRGADVNNAGVAPAPHQEHPRR